MDIVIATNNIGKVKEIKAILSGHNVMSQSEAGLHVEPVEDGDSFAANALIKARALRELTDMAVIADDSGIEVDALGGAPGMYSARFAGENGTPEQCNEKMLKSLEGVPFEKRTARYVCAMAFIEPNGCENVFEGTCEGYIIDECRGTNGFGYDPMFYKPEFDKTFGELDSALKDKVSHRYNALKKLSDYLDSQC